MHRSSLTQVAITWANWGLLFIALLFFGNNIIQLSPNYLPIWSDEFIYYMNAYSAFTLSSLEASLTFNGTGASIGGAAAHGPMYSLTYASISWFIGWHSLNIVFANIAFIMAAAALASFRLSHIPKAWQVWAAATILLYPVSMQYAFTFMQEMIQALFAVLLSLQLMRLYQKDAPRIELLKFCLLLLVCILYRPTWFLWGIALLPLSRSYKSFIAYAFLFLASMALSFLYVKYFFEYVPNSFHADLQFLLDGDILSYIIAIWWHTINNLSALASWGDLSYLLMRWAPIGMGVFFSIWYLITKRRLFLSYALIVAINTLFLILAYYANDWREVRFLAPIFYGGIPILAKEFKSPVKLLLPLLLLPFCYKAMHQRKLDGQGGITSERMLELQRSLRGRLPKHSGPMCIKLDFVPQDYSLDLLSLPVRQTNGEAIRYIVPYYSVELSNYDYILEKDKEGMLHIKPATH